MMSGPGRAGGAHRTGTGPIRCCPLRLVGHAQVRTRADHSGAWSDWHPLDTDTRSPEAGPARAKSVVHGGT